MPVAKDGVMLGGWRSTMDDATLSLAVPVKSDAGYLSFAVERSWNQTGELSFACDAPCACAGGGTLGGLLGCGTEVRVAREEAPVLGYEPTPIWTGCAGRRRSRQGGLREGRVAIRQRLPIIFSKRAV